MDWLACLKEAIRYMEEHLTDIRSPEEVAEHVHVSCMYLQTGFRILTGYTLGEYMRNRRLYLAAVDLTDPAVSVLDTALKYGYETQASFDKAFVRFHGVTPKDIRRAKGAIRSFRPMNFSISVQGGEGMNFRIEKKDGLRLVGFQRVFDCENSYQTIPAYWDEIMDAYIPRLMKGLPPTDAMETYIAAHHIGEFGVCVDDIGMEDKFSYMIAGYRDESEPPSPMKTIDIDAGEWAVFDCTLATLQSTNTQIWKEWVPGNAEYEPAGRYNIEWYSPEGEPGPAQQCQIWIPVRKK